MLFRFSYRDEWGRTGRSGRLCYGLTNDEIEDPPKALKFIMVHHHHQGGTRSYKVGHGFTEIDSIANFQNLCNTYSVIFDCDAKKFKPITKYFARLHVLPDVTTGTVNSTKWLKFFRLILWPTFTIFLFASDCPCVQTKEFKAIHNPSVPSNGYGPDTERIWREGHHRQKRFTLQGAPW